MNSIDNYLICIFLFALLVVNDCTDPDEQLCTDLTVDAAVLVDMETPTVFKGDHYWKFDFEAGLSLSFGEKISDRWPGLPTPLNAAFSISDETHGNSTVFITKETKWYYYKGRTLIKNGSTSEWSFFPKQPIDAVLTHMKHFKNPKDYEIYVMFGDSYSAYTFQNINNPTYHYTRKAHVNGTMFLWLTARKEEAGQTIDQIIKVKAAISERFWVLFFGYKNWCKAVTFSTWYKCEPQDSDQFFRCPRETRPVTQPPPTQKPKPTKKPQSQTKSPQEVTDEGSDDPNFTRVSAPADDNNGTRNKLTTKNPEESKLSKEKTKKSSSTLMFVIIILVVLVILFVIIIAVVFLVIKNKKRDPTTMSGRKGSQDSIRNFEQREQRVSRRRTRTPSEESISSLIGRSKSKASLTTEVDDNNEEENEENGDNDTEEKGDDKIEKSEDKEDEKSEDKNEQKSEDKIEQKSEDKIEQKSEDKNEQKSEAKNVYESENKVDNKNDDKNENKTEDKDKSISKDGEEDKKDL